MVGPIAMKIVVLSDGIGIPHKLAAELANFYGRYFDVKLITKNPFIQLLLYRPNRVHAHNLHSKLGWRTLVYARLFTALVYLTLHDCAAFTRYKYAYEPLSRKETIRAFIIRRIIHLTCKKVFAVSNSQAEALRAHGIECEVIHNSVDVSKWTEPPDVSEFKKKHGIGSNAILFAGRMSYFKGCFLAIDLLKAIPDAQLLVASTLSQTEEMVAYAKKIGVSDRVIFLGYLADMRYAYYSSQLLVVPSIYLDPFPTVNLEAFACKRPVVATKWGGSKELVKDGVSGYVRDPQDFVDAVKDLLAESTKRNSFGEKGYEDVRVDSMGADYMKAIYDTRPFFEWDFKESLRVWLSNT
jgi:glycosyltransferase involved in cell wall biosynthesis